MKYRILGETGLTVSHLCFGALTISPLQKNMSIKAGARVIRRALELGVNFIDTAQLYDAYDYIREALKGWDRPVVICTKSYAYTRELMVEALEEARQRLQRDVIDIFMLHEQESIHTIRGHWPALEVLFEAKAKGIVRAVGISTHCVAAVRQGAQVPEIEVISPLINPLGLGIIGGTAADMLDAIEFAHLMGKGVYAMKPLAGGHLYHDVRASLEWAFSNPHVHSVAVGMQSEAEVDANVAICEGRDSEELLAAAAGSLKQLHIDDWCTACGTCIQACSSRALALRDGKLHHDPSRCVLCGYCAARCPEFALKVI
ncbi:MAG: 4Fe-4S binding protein [Firmicutes bacterium]|nr:4Fe-4S binding protein [Bacillota bacterium]